MDFTERNSVKNSLVLKNGIPFVKEKLKKTKQKFSSLKINFIFDF
jgi:hypothetical protein